MISKVYGHIATATCLAFSLFVVGSQLPKSKMLNNYSSNCSYNGEDISYSLADKKFEVSKNGEKIVSYGTGEQFSFSNGGYGLNCNAVAVGVKAVVDGVAAGAAATEAAMGAGALIGGALATFGIGLLAGAALG